MSTELPTTPTILRRPSRSLTPPTPTSTTFPLSDSGSEPPIAATTSSRSPAPSTAPSVSFSLSGTSSISTFSSAASCAMMGLGTREGEEMLKEALRGGMRAWCLGLGEKLESLLSDPIREVVISPTTSTHRLLTYKAAEWYGLTAGTEEMGGIVVTVSRNGEGSSGSGNGSGGRDWKNPTTLQLAKLVPRPSSPPKVKVTLMKRSPPTTSASSTPPPNALDATTSARRLAEREASYLRARARIFTDGREDGPTSETASISDTQSVRSGRSSNGTGTGTGKTKRTNDTLRQRRRIQEEEHDDEFRRDVPLLSNAVGYRHPVPTFEGYQPPPMIPPQGMAYSQPIYNSVASSSSSYDPMAYVDQSYMPYSDGSYYYPVMAQPPIPGMGIHMGGYQIPQFGGQDHFLSCTPTPVNQPLGYAAIGGGYQQVGRQMMSVPVSQVPAAARLESYLQTSTGPYPPGPRSTSSYRSTGSPVPSTLDFDVRSTFSTDSAPVSAGGEGSKLSSPAPSRGGSGGGSVSVGGMEERHRTDSFKDESCTSPDGTRTAPRFALPPKPTWVSQTTPNSSRSSESSRSVPSKGKSAVHHNHHSHPHPHPHQQQHHVSPRPMHPRPSLSVTSTVSAPAAMTLLPTILRRPLSPTQSRGINDVRNSAAVDLDFPRRDGRAGAGKLFDPSSGRVIVPPPKKGTVGYKAPPRSEERSSPLQPDVNEVIEAKLQALAIVHNVSIGPPPLRKPTGGTVQHRG